LSVRRTAGPAGRGGVSAGDERGPLVPTTPGPPSCPGREGIRWVGRGVRAGEPRAAAAQWALARPVQGGTIAGSSTGGERCRSLALSPPGESSLILGHSEGSPA
jgi:hypothetical protein